MILEEFAQSFHGHRENGYNIWYDPLAVIGQFGTTIVNFRYVEYEFVHKEGK